MQCAIGLVNVLRRPGCPVAVRGETGASYREGLDPGIGIVNWHGGLLGKNCPFFADLGLQQILSGYFTTGQILPRRKGGVEKQRVPPLLR